MICRKIHSRLTLTRNRNLVNPDIRADDKVQEIMTMVKKIKAERSVIFSVVKRRKSKCRVIFRWTAKSQCDSY